MDWRSIICRRSRLSTIVHFSENYLIILGLQRCSGLADTLPQASHEYFIVASLPLQTWAAEEPQNLVSSPSAVGLQRLLEVSADAPQFWHVYVIVLLLLFVELYTAPVLRQVYSGTSPIQ